MLNLLSIICIMRKQLLIEKIGKTVAIIDLDHDLGTGADGGDGIKLLDWLVERKTFYPVRVHTINPVRRENMQRMIDRYWR